jgi:hypothetical protein
MLVVVSWDERYRFGVLHHQPCLPLLQVLDVTNQRHVEAHVADSYANPNHSPLTTKLPVYHQTERPPSSFYKPATTPTAPKTAHPTAGLWTPPVATCSVTVVVDSSAAPVNPAAVAVDVLSSPPLVHNPALAVTH